MFENKQANKILEDALAKGKQLGVDVRQGSIYYDAVAGVCTKLAMFYVDLKSALDLVLLDTAPNEYLDKLGSQFKIPRIPATAARYYFYFEGTTPAKGERFFTNGHYFTLTVDNDMLVLEADESGISENSILPNTAAVPKNNISLKSATFGELYEPGSDAESDENYRQRIREKIAGPAENGNRQHYKTWCEEVSGVGRARIVPLFAGENTVMGVIFGTDGYPATDAVVERVQSYIDPITKNIEKEFDGQIVIVGDGLGNGIANIGAHFYATAAQRLPVTVSFRAALSSSSTKEQVVQEATEAIREYFKTLALNSSETEQVVVRISKVGAILFNLSSIIDYTDLSFNGQSSNIEVKEIEAAVLTEVLVDV